MKYQIFNAAKLIETVENVDEISHVDGYFYFSSKFDENSSDPRLLYAIADNKVTIIKKAE